MTRPCRCYNIRVTRTELQNKRTEYLALIERLEGALATPYSSISISAGGGSKSVSTSSPTEIRKSIAYYRRQVQLIDAALGVAPAPGTPSTVEVRFDA